MSIQTKIGNTDLFSFSDVSMAPDNSGYIYAVGSDKTIKQFQESQTTKEVDLHTITLSTVVLSHDGTMLFTGSRAGRIQSFKFPLTLPGVWVEYNIHGDSITQMKLSLDDNRLITASKDGSLCFWQVTVFNLRKIILSNTKQPGFSEPFGKCKKFTISQDFYLYKIL